jgi:hypothetical protein
MFNQLGPLEIVCNAPEYYIVRACRDLGFQEPEDVRWCRMNDTLKAQASRQEPAALQSWKLFWGMNQRQPQVCQCGLELPDPEQYTFQLRSGTVLTYWLCQCRRCRAIFWENA